MYRSPSQILFVLVVSSIILCLAASSAYAAAFRVNAASTAAAPDGTSWATAYKDVQSAVDAASAAGDSEVWVAAGTYTATTDPVVIMKTGINIYGGFAATETDRDQRDWTAHTTTIDGENTRRCVYGADNATLDGFTVTKGKTDADFGGGMLYGSAENCTFSENRAIQGGGMCTYTGTATNCIFSGNLAYGGVGGGTSGGTATNCIFSENKALCGGGMSYGTVTNCTFSGNSAAYGGGMYGGSAANCTFSENSAAYGGGMFYGAATNSTFSRNSADQYGGGKFDGAATNCTFSRNSADDFGGGIYRTTATNCTLSANSARDGGGMYYGTAMNCILWSNTPTEIVNTQVTYSCLSTLEAGTGNIVGDPLFIHSSAGDFRLRAGSPCIDVGTAQDTPTVDRLGRSRPQSAGIDMGAYEYCAGDVTGVGEPVVVPAIAGLPETTAEFCITGAGLVLGTSTSVCSTIIPKGSVISQTPAAGEIVAVGSAVDLVISLGASHTADVNSDGAVDAMDVQLTINAALGLLVPVDCDIDGDHVVDIMDVQLAINAALRLW